MGGGARTGERCRACMPSGGLHSLQISMCAPTWRLYHLVLLEFCGGFIIVMTN